MILSLLLGMIKHSQYIQSSKFPISLQYLNKEVRNRDYFLHADKHQNFYKLGLLFLMEVTRYVWSTKNKKLLIFFQYIKKRVSQLLLCSIVIQNIQIFYRGPVMYIVTCFLTQTGCRSFLPEHCNTIIKQQLRGEKWPSLLSFVQVDFFFQEKQSILQFAIQIILPKVLH